ncbi:hypothetical protein AN958_09462 [Leucoagaricus sp. SymC.cos]|nr:hypothetical protein AN958_09462 [Leucoagaricus sp. SymC.cos]
MLGLDGYGSGSESESDKETQNVAKSQPVASPAPSASKSKFNLPPPSASTSSSSKISLPPPKTTKRAPKKITIGLPILSKDESEEKDDLEPERPAAKRQKTGAGASALLSMLPAPKQKAAVVPQPERVLGGGKGPGLVFNNRPSVPSTQKSAVVEDGDGDGDEKDEEQAAHDSPAKSASSAASSGASPLPFLPPSLAKGKANISLEDKPKKPPLPSVSSVPAVDFFSLGNSKKTTDTTSTLTSSSFSIPTLSSAPSVSSFQPPEPTPQDQYPGYYQLPSGQWAAYEPGYYEPFRQKWQKEYDAYVRGLEKGALKGFEGYEEGASEVDAMKEMEKAKVEVKEREERKALSKGGTGPAEQPKMKFSASKLSGIARSRNQLSTLLKNAYENREALEEKIAEGRRNRKEAGNKYGF